MTVKSEKEYIERIRHIIDVGNSIHWFCHNSKTQVERWAYTLVENDVKYLYEFRHNADTGKTWVLKKYDIMTMDDKAIKRCLNSMKIATYRLPSDKATTMLKTAIDLFNGDFKW